MTSKYFAKAVIFAILSALISTPLQILNSIFILGEQSPPEASFLIPVGIIGIIMKTLYAMAYVLLGNKLLIKNQRLRAFIFIVLIWSTAYLPQVLGLIGADGPIAEVSFNIPILICDSLSYVFDGILLGLLYKEFPYHKALPCSKSALIKSMLVSSVTFPIITFVLEQLLGAVYPALYIHNAMQVSNDNVVSFNLTFYGFFIITGALLPLFYRLTEYNNDKPKSALQFGFIFSICLWSPVVAIMIAFGTAVLPTLIYIVAFFISIMTVSYMNGILIRYFSVQTVN